MARTVKDLRGRIRKWNPRSGRVSKRSKLHQRALQLLKELYPSDKILEEVKVPGSALRLDLFLPSLNLAVEVQGQQHSKYNLHFHKGIAGFLNSNARDDRKRQFCEQNKITLVELPWDEDDYRWSLRITTR